MIDKINKFERGLPCFLGSLKYQEIPHIIQLVKGKNLRNNCMFGPIEANCFVESCGNDVIKFKDMSNPEFLDFAYITLHPFTIVYGKGVLFEEGEEGEFPNYTKELKMVFHAYEKLRRSILEREYFNNSEYISQRIETFEGKIHSAMRNKLDEFALITEICKKAKMVKCEDIIVEYCEDKAMHIKLENKNIDIGIYINPLYIKFNNQLVYDFNWTVRNTDITCFKLKKTMELYEIAKMELLEFDANHRKTNIAI